jgi:trk system potassium uptake protein TrkH
MIVSKKNQSIQAGRWINARPGRVIALSFLLIISIGTILLVLPISSRNGTSIGFLQALFAATSATCVTGLVTVDTATHWSIFGKIVILTLIQIGGLGLVTITSFFYTMMRRKASLKAMVVTQESTASFGFADVMKLVRRVIIITFSIELVGAIILSWRFISREGFWRGIGKGIFHAVSSFCNAGFDLQGDTAAGPFSSLTAYQNDSVVVLTTALLIIVGGLGFVVWTGLLEWPREKRLNFHSRIVLILTGTLLLVGTVFFYFAESGNTSHPLALGSLPPLKQPLAAFFQSLTPRTAGFNTIDQASLTDSSKFMTILLMFIGAAPGSTAGGIKITTFAVVVATIISDIQRRDEIVLLRHRLPRDSFTRALAIMGLAMSIVLTTTMLLTFFERAALETGRFGFIDLLFEAASAFGTVGLSAVGTPSLSQASWILLIPVMYLGRVGPASFAIGLALPRIAHTERVHPEGRTMVG